MTQEISHIIKDVVASIDPTIQGTYNAGTGVTEFCDTKWTRKGKIITDDSSNNFLVSSIEYDESIVGTYQGILIPPPDLDGTITLASPYFISGTKLATNREWTRAERDLTKKTPLIWLLETIQETRFGRGDSRDASYNLRMFFLDETNVKDFVTEDHRREVVLPMQKLVEAFIDAVNRDRQFQTIETYTMRTFSRFGVEGSNGMFENVLDANLSGVELIIDLVRYKDKCKNC